MSIEDEFGDIIEIIGPDNYDIYVMKCIYKDYDCSVEMILGREARIQLIEALGGHENDEDED